MIQKMDTLEANRAPEIEVSSSSSASSIGSPQPTITNDHGPTDRRREEARSGIAAEADSVGASRSTADRISHQDRSWQAYKARRDCVFSRLGTERAFGGNDAARAVSAQSSGIVDRDQYLGQAAPCFQAAARWCLGVAVLDKYDGKPMKECAMQHRYHNTIFFTSGAWLWNKKCAAPNVTKPRNLLQSHKQTAFYSRCQTALAPTGWRSHKQGSGCFIKKAQVYHIPA